MSNQRAQSGGIGMTGAVFLVFLVLKLIGKIDWSWWWVTAPLWMPLGAVVAILAIVALFAGASMVVISAVDAIKERRK